MKTIKSIIAILAFFSIAAFSQHIGGEQMRQQSMPMMSQNMMQNSPNQMHSISDMIKQVKKLRKETNDMLSPMLENGELHDHDFDAEMEVYVGREELEQQAHQNNPPRIHKTNETAVEMMYHVVGMADDLTTMMEQMQKTMIDPALAHRPEMVEHLQQMEKHINELVGDMHSLLRSAKKLQKEG